MAAATEHIAGYHAVAEALRAGRRKLFGLRVRQGLRHAGLGELRALADGAGIPVQEMAADALRQGLAPGVRDQGLVLDAGPLPELGLEDLIRARTGGSGDGGAPGNRRLVILNGVEDPQNLGAVARAAEGSGAIGLLLAERRAAPLSAAAVRASAGALEHLPVARVPNLARALRSLRDAGFWLIGADAEDAPSLFEVPRRTWEGDLGLVLGAEGRGIRPGVARLLDHRVRIPMAGRVASLNVAAAAAVLLFEAARWAKHPEGAGEGAPVTTPASARNA